MKPIITNGKKKQNNNIITATTNMRDITNNNYNYNNSNSNNTKTKLILPHKKMDEMLLQIRQLITNNNNNDSSNSKGYFNSNNLTGNNSNLITPSSSEHQNNPTSPLLSLTTNTINKLDYPSIITQSSRLLQQRKQFTQLKPSTKGKIMAASQLLKQQPDMIKSYVKDKIQSGLFDGQINNINKNKNISRSSLQQHQRIDGNNEYTSSSIIELTNDKYLSKLQQQRQFLIKKKQQQHEKEMTRRQQLISQVKQFQTDSRVNVDVHQINSLIFKQQPQSMYLLTNNNDNGISTGKQVKSTSNQLKCNSLFISEVYDQHESEKYKQMQRIDNNKNIKHNNKTQYLQQQQHQNYTINTNNNYYHQQQLQQQYVQIHDDIETSYNNKLMFNSHQFQQLSNNNNNINQTQQTKRLRKILTKNNNKSSNFVKVFYQFLKNQYEIMKVTNRKINLLGVGGQSGDGLIFNSKLSQNSGGKGNNNNGNNNGNYMWKNQKFKPLSTMTKNNININTINTTKNRNQLTSTTKNTNNKQTLTTISQTYKFKPFQILTQNNKIQFQRQKISQRRVNKMIGQSSKFHAKKCILTKNQLIYYQQKQTNSTVQENRNKKLVLQMAIPQTTKHIQLEIQKIQPEVFKKQQGSFFSKKEINTQIVTVKGKSRMFTFQYEFLQGKELVGDLRKLMAAKVYALGCKVNGSNNLSLLQFIYNNKSTQFTLNQQSLSPIQSYLIKQDRQKHISILTDSLSSHPKLSTLNLKNTPLQQNQISFILKSFKQLQTLNSINLTNIRLTKQNFMQLCQFVNDIKIPSSQKNGIQVILTNCRLDDDCFLSNVGLFTMFCTKVSQLNLSQNSITAKTIQVIKTCLQSATSIVKHLDISNCPIRDLSKLNSLIKQSRKLQTLQAQNCNLHFDQKRFEQMQKFFDFLKGNNSSNSIKHINLCKNGTLTRKQYTMIQSIWYEKNIQQLVVDLDLEMLNQNKGGKNNNQRLLMRTDNIINNSMVMKNMLNMRLYSSRQQQKMKSLTTNK